jgi:hypothetical protein
MIDYQKMLLGKTVQVFTQDHVQEGIYEGMQVLGPFNEGSLFVVLKLEEDRTMFIPERIVERIYLVEESSVPGKDGEESGDN